MAETVSTKKKNPAVLRHYEISHDLPNDGNVKLKCKYCKNKSLGQRLFSIAGKVFSNCVNYCLRNGLLH